jgi:hypothetical protein
MKLDVLQIRDHIYYEAFFITTKKIADDFADEVIVFFYTRPKQDKELLYDIGKIMKKYKLCDDKLREYITKCYQWFLE